MSDKNDDAPPPNRWQRTLLVGLLLAVLAARHLTGFHEPDSDVASDFDAYFPDHLRAAAQGHWGLPGPALWDTPLRPSPLFYWLHLPALLAENGVTGVRWLYVAMDGAALLFWLLWGRRRRSGDLIWTAALFLALYPGGRMAWCENSTVAVYFSGPLFIALLAGLGARPWWAAVLPGVLLGLAVQVHLLAAVCAVPVVLAGLLCRKRSWSWLAGATVGFLTVQAALMSLAERGPWAAGGGTLPDVAWRAALAEAVTLLPGLFPDAPLLLGGLVLVLVRWWRGRPGQMETTVAALWLLTAGLLTCLALMVRGPTGAPTWEIRLGLINPARAVLSATLVLAAIDALARLLRRTGWLRLSRSVALTAASLVAVGVCGWQVVALWRHRVPEIRETISGARPSAPPQTDPADNPLQRLRPAPNFERYIDLALDRWPGLRGHAVPSTGGFHGLMWRRMEAAAIWARSSVAGRRAGGRTAAPPTVAGHDAVLLSPALPGLDLNALPGARRVGPLVWVGRLRALPLRRGAGADRFVAKLPAKQQKGWTLALTTHARRDLSDLNLTRVVRRADGQSGATRHPLDLLARVDCAGIDHCDQVLRIYRLPPNLHHARLHLTLGGPRRPPPPAKVTLLPPPVPRPPALR